MKKIGTVLIAFVVVLIGLYAATHNAWDNSMAKNYGGTITVEVKQGYKVVEATWKEDQLWYLTEPMEEEYTPKTKEFVEHSEYGILEGKVIFKESK